MGNARNGTWGCLGEKQVCNLLQIIFICPVLVDQSDNATVMEGMPATFSCSFQSDLAVLVHWVRPSRKAIENNMEGFDPKDPTSFEAVIDPATGMSATGETLTITDTKTSDSGLYFCAGQTNSGITPGFLHLKVREQAPLRCNFTLI